MTTANVFNLQKLYKEYFGRENFLIGNKEVKTSEPEFSKIPKNPHPKGTIHKSRKTGQTFNKIGKYGQDIWFPIKFESKRKITEGKYEDVILEIEACTVSVKCVTNIVSTPLASYSEFIINEKGEKQKNPQRNKGTVNEIVNLDDYKFTIRGFLIGENRKVPEDEIEKLKYYLETTENVELHGGFVELFLDATCLIKISKLDFPEVQGQNYWIRPFKIECQSNFITDLEF